MLTQRCGHRETSRARADDDRLPGHGRNIRRELAAACINATQL